MAQVIVSQIVLGQLRDGFAMDQALQFAIQFVEMEKR